MSRHIEVCLASDDAFSIDTGLEPIGVVGPIYWVGSSNNLQPALKEWSGEEASADSPMPKSVSFLKKGKNSIVDGDMIAYLYLVGLFGIYSG